MTTEKKERKPSEFWVEKMIPLVAGQGEETPTGYVWKLSAGSSFSKVKNARGYIQQKGDDGATYRIIRVVSSHKVKISEVRELA